MFSTLFSATLLSLLAVRAVHADFTVQTPAFTQCAPARFSWDHTGGPYNIIIANETDPCGDTVADLGDHQSNSLTWNVTIPAGWKIMISVEDAHGDEAWSGAIVVQHSNDDSCLSAAERSSLNGGTPYSYVPNSGTTSSTAITYSSKPSQVPDSGAANAGANPSAIGSLNGAPSAHRIPVPAVLIGAIGAALVFAF